ncbi:MFS transporter [uncultured Agrococcus sp.]|uniref:MFS transporter n=1 Tax=uncultured Agrococcus sp. TaxID=382258 RepID=UPI0025D7B147|nr:MFS transporter [uncultured Agrococcus sp.]
MIGLSEIGRIAAPASIFLLTAAGFGAMTTFLPVAGPTAVEASWVLLTASLALIAGRLAAGMLGDRIGGGRVLITTVLITGLGLALISQALPHQSALLITGACLLGLGFGAGQNDSFVVIVQRLGPERSATASTLWNMAYDGGLGLGAITLGWVIGSTGYADAFLIAAFAIALFGLLIHLIAPGHRTRR